MRYVILQEKQLKTGVFPSGVHLPLMFGADSYNVTSLPMCKCLKLQYELTQAVCHIFI